MFEINKISERIRFNDFTYYYKVKGLIHFNGPLIIYNDITNSPINLQKEEKTQD